MVSLLFYKQGNLQEMNFLTDHFDNEYMEQLRLQIFDLFVVTDVILSDTVVGQVLYH